MIDELIGSEVGFAAISHRQEHFAAAQIFAICSTLGCGVASYTLDNDKVDLTVTSRLKGPCVSSPKIDIQSKCLRQTTWPQQRDYISFQIDKELYDRLRDEKVSCPVIIVVTVVPEKVDDWLEQSSSEMRLAHCSYWLSLLGEPELPEGQKTKTIKLPTKDIFDVNCLSGMMHDVANGLPLGTAGGRHG